MRIVRRFCITVTAILLVGGPACLSWAEDPLSLPKDQAASPPPAADSRPAAPDQAAIPAEGSDTPRKPVKEAVQETIKSVMNGEVAEAVQATVQDAVIGTLRNASPDAMKDTTLILRISKEFIRQHAPPQVEQVAPVDRCLFGAHVTGTATTSGQPVVSMDGDHTKPVFTLHFAGMTITHTVATKRPVKAFNTGRAVFDVHREIRFNGTEFSDCPETIECSYASTLNGLSVPTGVRGRIVRKLALPQLEKHRPAADAIALGDTKATILEAFGERTDTLVKDLNANVPWKQTLALLAPEKADWVGSFSSTQDWIEARSSHLDGPMPDLPEEAAQLKAPIELWVLGKPDEALSGKLLALWGVSHVALNRFRAVTPAPVAAVATGIEPAIVGDWWVIRVGTDLAERFLDGMRKDGDE